MATIISRPAAAPSTATPVGIDTARWDNPAFQAFWLLRLGFTVAPIAFGLDKFAHVLVDWTATWRLSSPTCSTPRPTP